MPLKEAAKGYEIFNSKRESVRLLSWDGACCKHVAECAAAPLLKR